MDSSSGEGSLFVEETTVVKIEKTEKEWKDILTPDKYRVLRRSGTERPFTGKYNDHSEKGIYVCGACGTPLFGSETKYDHGTGWPSFTAPVAEDHIKTGVDRSHGMLRTEVRCAACGSHLGHVFDDGPAPTGKHYCINSIALDFKPAGASEEAHKEETERAVFAAGCFWGVEDKFGKIDGVLSTRVGYTGGRTRTPLREVCLTRPATPVVGCFDPKKVGYAEL
jgi:peptide methionine sulfoxide reductase msrA/msrB